VILNPDLTSARLLQYRNSPMSTYRPRTSRILLRSTDCGIRRKSSHHRRSLRKRTTSHPVQCFKLTSLDMKVELYHHSRDTPATISKLLASIDRSTQEVIKSNPRCVSTLYHHIPSRPLITTNPQFRVLTKSTSAKVRITIRPPTLSLSRAVSIPLEPFAVNKDMGRILLRRGGETIAAGLHFFSL
jgi:hypothetical protein